MTAAAWGSALALGVAIGVAGCASYKTAADGTPLEDCNIYGSCTTYTAAEQANYRQYHDAYASDASQCRAEVRSQWRSRENENYFLKLNRDLSACNGDYKCANDKRMMQSVNRSMRKPEDDFRYTSCMSDRGWAGTGADGWRLGRKGTRSGPAASGGNGPSTAATQLPW